MKIAIVGCTGLVGSVILKVLRELKLPITSLLPVASEKSIGKEIWFNDQSTKIIGIEEALQEKPAMAIFSAGGTISKKWAKPFAENGITVIDNSSAWRMDEDVPLVVPEINGHLLTPNDKIIANPNCSTIQMVLALKNIYERFGLKRIVVSTYQSVSGTGAAAVEQMNNERKDNFNKEVYPHQIDLNCFPHGGDFLPNGYTSEELKLVNETRKIFNDETIQVSATVVRIPVIGGHSEAVNVETHKPFDIKEIKDALINTNGIVIQDLPDENLYPMPLTAHEKNEVFVGRIRRDNTIENGFNIWIVADNLRKGAATNAVQIAAHLIENKLV
ncbi:MAG: aspartate-semialdehyde dehydrogenase [Crocinitomicaceae bacterium]|nr:aspartate-semialdehyde dehydrogenase [Crocinitomicaceae bacterium]